MTLKEYIQGDKHGKEANRLERQAMNDPFLQDALEGFGAVTGDHTKVIENLEKRFATPVVGKFTRPVATIPQKASSKNVSMSNRQLYLYGSIAASILLLIGIGTFFLRYNNDHLQEAIVMLQSDETPPTPELPAPSEAFSELHTIESTPSIPATQMEADTLTSDKNAENLSTGVRNMPASSKKTVNEVINLVEDNINVETFDFSSEDDMSVAKKAEEAEKAFFVAEKSETIKTHAITVEEKEVAEEVDAKVAKEVADAVSDEIQRKAAQTARSKQSKAESQISRNNTGRMDENETNPITFGEREFQAHCRQKVSQNVCDSKTATVKVSFFIDAAGQPTQIKFIRSTCEKARKEIEHLLSSSPVWTTTNKNITMTIRW